MASLVLDTMDGAWTSLAPATLKVTADTAVTALPGAASNRLEAAAAAADADAERVLPASLDLRAFDELRFWVRADRGADGSAQAPFFLELSYVDDGDTPADDHRWLVPVNGAGKWWQCRIGIEGERRAAVSRLRLRALAGPFRAYIDELLAVFEEPIADVETALAAALAASLAGGPEPAVAIAAAANATEVTVTPMTIRFSTGNRVRITGGTAGPELHDVAGVAHDEPQNRTTLTFDAGDRLVGDVPSATATVAIFVPLIVEAPPVAPAAVLPAILATHVGVREDAQRSPTSTQRDSFRRRGAHTVCSVRPGPRALVVQYQLTAVGVDRPQQVAVQESIVRTLSPDRPLWVSGTPSPVRTTPVTEPETRRNPGLLAPTYLGVGTRVELAARKETVLAERAYIGGGPLAAPRHRRSGSLGGPGDGPLPDDSEGIVITL
jgi:hypothetical protein